MILRILITVILLGFIVLAIDLFMKSRENSLSFYESMSLTSLPIIILKISGQDFNFLLDTGSNSGYIDKALIDTKVVTDFTDTEHTTESTGIEGKTLNLPIINITLSTQNGPTMNGDFVVRDMSDAFNVVKQNSGVTIHGILGSNFFQKYKYIINFNELIAYK
jgi:hypothetical protein